MGIDMRPWMCDQCHQEQRWIEPRFQITVKEEPHKPITVCAVCHKKLTREKRISLQFL